MTTSGISYRSSVSASVFVSTLLAGVSGTSYLSVSVCGLTAVSWVSGLGCVCGRGLVGGAMEVSGISYLSSDTELSSDCFPETASSVSDAEVSDGTGVTVAVVVVVDAAGEIVLGGNAGGDCEVSDGDCEVSDGDCEVSDGSSFVADGVDVCCSCCCSSSTTSCDIFGGTGGASSLVSSSVFSGAFPSAPCVEDSVSTVSFGKRGVTVMSEPIGDARGVSSGELLGVSGGEV